MNKVICEVLEGGMTACKQLGTKKIHKGLIQGKLY